MKSSLLLVLVSLAALLALASGCSTVKTGNAVFIASLPVNTLVIRNNTPYKIEVLRNGVPWEDHRHGVKAHHPPVLVMPHQTLTLYNCASSQCERITLGLRATKIIRVGCLVGEAKIGSCNRVIDLGTNNPPKLITIRSWHF